MLSQQRSLLALLVVDLGYRKAPTYGTVSLRHFIAWQEATEKVDPEEIATFIRHALDENDLKE